MENHDQKAAVVAAGSRLMGLAILAFVASPCAAQDSAAAAKIPLTRLFDHAGAHALESVEYGYGWTYAAAGLATFGIVATGTDWKWRQASVDHKWIGDAGFVAVGAGGLVPMTLPLGLYLYGRFHDDPDLQLAGLALGQAALLGLAISSGIKVFTGRAPPDEHGHAGDFSGDFRFGFWRGGAFDGWPSSHTAIAFAMASALAGLYPGNAALEAGAFAYASLIGLGVSTNIHWLSDAAAGGLIGYAIGRAVGLGFARERKPQKVNFSVMPGRAAVSLRF